MVDARPLSDLQGKHFVRRDGDVSTGVLMRTPNLAKGEAAPVVRSIERPDADLLFGGGLSGEKLHGVLNVDLLLSQPAVYQSKYLDRVLEELARCHYLQLYTFIWRRAFALLERDLGDTGRWNGAWCNRIFYFIRQRREFCYRFFKDFPRFLALDLIDPVAFIRFSRSLPWVKLSLFLIRML